MTKLSDKLFRLIDFVTMALLVAMAVFVFLQVICRFIRISTPWTDEMARFCFIYITFLGSVTATRSESNIVIDVILERLPHRVRYGLKALIYAGVAVFLALFSRGAYATILTSGTVPSASLFWFKHSYIYGVVLFSTVLMILICGMHMIRYLGMAFGKGETA